MPTVTKHEVQTGLFSLLPLEVVLKLSVLWIWEVKTAADKQLLQGLTQTFSCLNYISCGLETRKVSTHVDLAATWDLFQPCLCEGFALASGLARAREFLSMGFHFHFLRD